VPPSSHRAAAEGRLNYTAKESFYAHCPSPTSKEQEMPIDLSTVNWLFVALMAVLAFVAALLGGFIAYRNRFAGAIIAGILFAVGFVAWNYYPHSFGLPIIKTIGLDNGAS
jgi:hypothetical protein